ncbi:hypothetical protein ANANG_G00023540 [Anguilla anguilla]|uniref:EF-hand domain-containing protein n=1 Tax=Anguilla anguilla TaxID=7936 RepID=A0A9D3MZP5_ANGAN|nr:hypothetical protein ANANG_G00023540 [Anguilla anguilla]
MLEQFVAEESREDTAHAESQLKIQGGRKFVNWGPDAKRKGISTVRNVVGWGLCYGMDEAQQDQYELQLREVFQSFDATGRGSLCRQELSDLCQTLHLEEATPTLSCS